MGLTSTSQMPLILKPLGLKESVMCSIWEFGFTLVECRMGSVLCDFMKPFLECWHTVSFPVLQHGLVLQTFWSCILSSPRPEAQVQEYRLPRHQTSFVITNASSQVHFSVQGTCSVETGQKHENKSVFKQWGRDPHGYVCRQRRVRLHIITSIL